MLNKKDIKYYKSIKAPNSLRDRVLNNQMTNSKKIISFSKKRIVLAIAASFLVVLSLSIVKIDRDKVSLLVYGKQPEINKAMVIGSERSIAQFQSEQNNQSLFIPLDIKTRQRTTINISDGYLLVLDKTTNEELNKDQNWSLNKSGKLFWVLEESQEIKTAQLTLSVIRKTTTFTLNYDNNNNEWTILKNK